MRLQRLSISNFMIFGEADIDLSDIRLASIVGEYAADSRRSNGAGKSAFMESIRFALFDQTRGKSKQGVVREGCDSCSVELTFEAGGSQFRVSRSRSKSGASKAKLWIDGKEAGDKVRVVNGVIAERLGVDADLFDLIYFFKQGDQFGFAEANASDRKSILSKVFRMKQLSQCSDAAKDMLRDAKAATVRVEGAIEATERQLESSLDMDSLLAQSLDSSAELANVMQLKEARRDAVDDLQVAAHDARSYHSYFSAMAGNDANQKATVELALQDIDKTIEARKAQLLEKRDKEHESRVTYQAIKDAAVKPDGDIEDLKVRRARLNNDMRVFTAKLIAAKADLTSCQERLAGMQMEDGACPTCGQQVAHDRCEEVANGLRDTADALNDFIADLERNIDMVESEVASCTRNISAHEQYAFKLKACENAWNNVQTCEDVCNDYRDDIAKLEEDKETLIKELERVSDDQLSLCATVASGFVDRLSDLATRVLETNEAMADQVSSMTSDSNAADFELATRRKQQQELVKYQVQRKMCDKDEHIASSLVDAFGKDGIQALIIENALGAIEQFANEMLQQMQTKFVVELKTQRQTKSGEDREALDILIYDGAGVRLFESYSGGERTLINLSLRLALSKAISALHGVSMHSLFMDEVFGALDEVNREEVVRVLSFLSRSFAQVLVVSHTDQVKDVIDSGIVIRRYDDKSEIRKTNARGKEAASSSASQVEGQ